jgi:hypothetical protein
MRDYSPKRRTALVFTGSGTAGAYHAGVLKALDETGVKIDLVVGSGVGTLAAAFAAVAGGSKLYGPGGFWDELGWSSLYRVRPALRAALLLLLVSAFVVLLPLALGLVAGLVSPLLIAADLAVPGLVAGLLARLGAVSQALRVPYLAALVAPIFLLSLLGTAAAARLFLRRRRRAGEALEFVLDAEAARRRLLGSLAEVTRAAVSSAGLPDEGELGRRYVALLQENLGQPGFRELVLRSADLDTGRALSFVALGEAAHKAFTAARGRGDRMRHEGLREAIDLRAGEGATLVFDAVLTGLLPPLVSGVRRVGFPRGGPHAGEVHRLIDAALAGGCGLAEALQAGAEQIVLVAAVPEEPALPARRRGPRALVDGVLALVERQALERDLRTAERLNRVIETLGHRTDDGTRAWEDPASGRVHREVGLYVIRPRRRGLLPLDFDGAEDPASEVVETPADLAEQGYRDAYREFLEPVLGAGPESRPAARPDETQAIQL